MGDNEFEDDDTNTDSDLEEQLESDEHSIEQRIDSTLEDDGQEFVWDESPDHFPSALRSFYEIDFGVHDKKTWLRDVIKQRKVSEKHQEKVNEVMITSYGKKHATSLYSVGETVLLENPKAKSRRGRRHLDKFASFEAQISEKKDSSYKVSYETEHGEHMAEWVDVSKITSRTQTEENRRNKSSVVKPKNEIKKKSKEPRDILRERLAVYDLVQVETTGDGSCFFRAMPRMIYGTEDYHLLIRKQALERMADQPQDFAESIEESLDEYIVTMADSRTWADDAVIRATADAFNVEINIISTAHDHVITFRPVANIPLQSIYLGHIAGLHYVSTESVEEPQHFRYGSRASDGVVLNNTTPLDTTLTWLLNLKKTTEDFKLFIKHAKSKNLKTMWECFREFENGNSVNSKRRWYDAICKTKSKNCGTLNIDASDTQLCSDILEKADNDISMPTPFMIIHHPTSSLPENISIPLRDQQLLYEKQFVSVKRKVKQRDQYSSFFKFRRQWYYLEVLSSNALTKQSAVPDEIEGMITFVAYFCLTALLLQRQQKDTKNKTEKKSKDKKSKKSEKNERKNNTKLNRKKEEQKNRGRDIDVENKLKDRSGVQLVLRAELEAYIEFDRTKQQVNDDGDQYLDNLENEMALNGLFYALELAVSKKTGRAYLYEGNHRMAILKRNNTRYVPLKVTYYFINNEKDERFNKIPGKIPEDWPRYPTPSNMGFFTKAFEPRVDVLVRVLVLAFYFIVFCSSVCYRF